MLLFLDFLSSAFGMQTMKNVNNVSLNARWTLNAPWFVLDKLCSTYLYCYWNTRTQLLARPRSCILYCRAWIIYMNSKDKCESSRIQSKRREDWYTDDSQVRAKHNGINRVKKKKKNIRNKENMSKWNLRWRRVHRCFLCVGVGVIHHCGKIHKMFILI